MKQKSAKHRNLNRQISGRIRNYIRKNIKSKINKIIKEEKREKGSCGKEREQNYN